MMFVIRKRHWTVLSELAENPDAENDQHSIWLEKHYAPAGVGDHAPARAARRYPKLARSNHAKLDQNNCVAGSARQSRSNCADHWKRDILCWARKHDRAPVADAKHAIDRRRADWPPPAACTRGSIGERRRSR